MLDEKPVRFLPFAMPEIGAEEIEEVVDSLRSGWLTTGPKVKRFEQDFAEFLGEGHEAIAVSSATAGLHLALEAVGVGPGDDVITTPYTFTATAEVIRYLGANPVFVDIDPDTLNIDPEKVEQAITRRTKALIPVHFGGLACEMDALLQLARKYGIKIIEDAAHALPATYKGSLVGTLNSDATVYSFYATKTLATGEGGMVATRNPDIAKRCRVMSLHGIDRDAHNRYTSAKPAWFYEVVAPGFKYNMTDLAASLGIHQLKKVFKFRESREQMAKLYSDAFRNLPVRLPPNSKHGDLHAWHLYVIRLERAAGVHRDRFIELMFERGIGCSVHFIPLHVQPYWRDEYKLKPQDFPNAFNAYKDAISLPLYTRMTENDVTRVIQAVHDVLATV